MNRFPFVWLVVAACQPASLYSDDPSDPPPPPPIDAAMLDAFIPSDAGAGVDAGPPPFDAGAPDTFVPIDSGTIADCVYPSGPTGLGSGDVIAPYTWSNARDETGAVFDFSLEDFHCDPEYAAYKSIVLYVGAGWCPSCPQEMRRVNSMASQLQSERALIVYMEGQDRSYNDASSASAADFVESVIGSSAPGIRIGDGESSSPMAIFRTLRTVPSGFFIRRSDMRIVAAGPESGTLRYDQLAREANTADPGPDPEPPPPPPTCTEEPGEPNDELGTATPLSGTVTGGICNARPDYFRVNVAGAWRVDLDFSHAQGDLDLYVISGSSRVASSDSTTDDESVSWTGPAIVEVLGYRGATASYQITLTGM